MMQLKTVYTSNLLVDCYLIKGRLETEGISCFVFDENFIGVNPFYAIAIGGVKLKVPSDQFEQATELLDLISNSKLFEAVGENSFAEIVEVENRQIVKSS